MNEHLKLLEKRTRYACNDIISSLSDVENKIFGSIKCMREARTQIEAARHSLAELEESLRERGII